MNSRIRHLKVKVKSLAAEARIIRQEERRSKGPLRESLAEHRRGVVRNEARHSQIAYALLRGKPYDEIEGTNSKPFDIKKVLDMAARFGACRSSEESYKEWQERLRHFQACCQTWIESAAISRV